MYKFNVWGRAFYSKIPSFKLQDIVKSIAPNAKIKLIDGLHIAGRPQYANNNNWMISIVVNKKKFGKSKENLFSLLQKNKIQSRSMWLPIHMQKKYTNFEKYKITNAIKLFKNSLNIPCSTNLTLKDASKVLKVLNYK